MSASLLHNCSLEHHFPFLTFFLVSTDYLNIHIMNCHDQSEEMAAVS